MFRIFGRTTKDDGPPSRLDPPAAARWVEGLPPFAPLATLAALHDALKTLNGLSGPAARRVETLAPLRSRLHDLFRVFPTHLMQQNLRSGRERLQANGLLERALHRLSGGYNLAVAELLEGAGRTATDSPLLDALWGSMETNVLRLRHAYRSYGPVPRQVYHDLHRLYRLAEEHRALYLPPPFADAGGEDPSLGIMYRRILMLTVADPFHMAHGEADAAHELLGGLANQAVVRPADRWQPGVGRFLVDMAGDSPPRTLPPEPPAGPRDALRILDLRPALDRALQAEVNREASAAHRLQADRNRWLVDHLTKRFRGEKRRRHRREPAHWTALATSGLDQVVAAIEAGAAAAPLGGVEVDPAGGARAAHLTRWTIVEQSANGFRLAQEASAAPVPGVGDLVALVDEAEAARNSPFTVCLVQWLRFLADGHLITGLEVLGRSPLAVRLRPEDDAAAAPLPGVVLAQADGGSRTSFMLTGHGRIRPDRRYLPVTDSATPALVLGPPEPLSPVIDRHRLRPRGPAPGVAG